VKLFDSNQFIAARWSRQSRRYDLRKYGAIGFSHPNGTHDDVFWATALAIYATVEMAPEPFLAVIPR
jgi:hypothetical protein